MATKLNDIIARRAQGLSFSTGLDCDYLVGLVKEMSALIEDAIETPDQFETDWNKQARAVIAKIKS